MKNRDTVKVHFYRATVMHADVWRRRLDVTTNWSIISSVGIVSYVFSDTSHPAVGLLIAFPFLMIFLYMESRRYQMYDLWRSRVRMLNRYMVAPAFSACEEESEDDERDGQELEAMATSLGTSIPRISVPLAMGYRIRRNYWLLFSAIVSMWCIKLVVHPTAATSFHEVLQRARVGFVGGGWVTLSVLSFLGVVYFLALRAPTEQMHNWIRLESPLERLLPGDMIPQEVSMAKPCGDKMEKKTSAPKDADG